MGQAMEMEMETMAFTVFEKFHVHTIFKGMVNVICIIVYRKILSISWQYIASLHIIPNLCFSKCVCNI
jgi:hypothetical protein